MESESETVTLPLLPLSSIVYTPGRSIEFEISPEPFHENLFEYTKNHTDNFVAIAYPKKEDGPWDGPLSSVVTVIKMDVCEPVIRKGELWSYSIESRGLYKAKIVHLYDGLGFRMAQLSKMEEQEISLTDSERLSFMLPLWANWRLLIGLLDNWECIVPSHGNKIFKQYFQDLELFILTMSRALPLTYRQKVRLLEANDVCQRISLLSLFAKSARINGYRAYRDYVEQVLLVDLVNDYPYLHNHDN